MLKQIPYGISNFKDLRDENMYYIDKTFFIQLLEEKPKYQFFIRPRRFGKSLFLSMLETYYDIYEKENFDKYFGDLYISKNKTSKANSLLILSISFADVISDQGEAKLVESFDNIVSSAINECIKKYSDILKTKELPENQKNATFALRFLRSMSKSVNAKVLLLIDEYDNFANNIMTYDKELYYTLTHKDGYIKTFYKSIKEATADGVITRAFITGVSPIMLDDLTSGANIFQMVSNDANLNDMLGFTDQDLKNIINYYEIDKKVSKKALLETLKLYCDGYRFTKEDVPTMYNTDMVLYILNSIITTGKYPQNLIDDNIKTDYTRLRKITEFFDSKEELNKIITNTITVKIQIKDRFNLESLNSDDEKYQNLMSLLYYLGMLTIDKPYANKAYLKIPNYAIKELYWDYMLKSYGVKNIANYQEIDEAMHKMRMEGDITDIINLYERVLNVMSAKDLSFFNETTCKAFFITLVFVDGIYLIASEREAGGGFSDLYLKENIQFFEEIKYRYVFEFKYIKAGDLKGLLELPKNDLIEKNKKIIQSTKQEATEQLHRYTKDYNIQNDSDRILKKYTVVVLGRKYVLVDEI